MYFAILLIFFKIVHFSIKISFLMDLIIETKSHNFGKYLCCYFRATVA